MKVKLNDNQVFELNETKQKVLKNDIDDEIFEQDLERRLKWVLEHKYEQCFKRLKEQWEPKLKANGVASIPLDEDAFAELVFSQPEYKDRKQRELEQRQSENI